MKALNVCLSSKVKHQRHRHHNLREGEEMLYEDILLFKTLVLVSRRKTQKTFSLSQGLPLIARGVGVMTGAGSISDSDDNLK